MAENQSSTQVSSPAIPLTTASVVCCDCGKDLPVPRNNARKRCAECSHKRDTARTAAWQRAHSSHDLVKKRCEYQGGAGREEQYRPPTPCLREFEVAPKNAKRAKYCKVCRPFAKKALSAENANAAYKAEPEQYAKITRENRWKRRKKAGKPVRQLGRTYRCEYRKDGKRGEGCAGKFKATSSAQKFCEVCQKHADADRAQRYRDDHHDELLPMYRAKGERLRQLAKVGNKLSALSSMTKASQTAGVALLVDGGLTNRELRDLAGGVLSARQLVRIREVIDVPAPKGRPSKKP